MIIRDEDPPVPVELCSHEHVTTRGAPPNEVTRCYDCKSEWPKALAPNPHNPPVGTIPRLLGTKERADTIQTP